MSSSVRSQRSLNFWDELQRKGIQIPEKLDNQRFAYEMDLRDFFRIDEISEKGFRRFNGAACRIGNGYCKLFFAEDGMRIIVFRKPFAGSEISVYVAGEFIVIRAHHALRVDCMEYPISFEERACFKNKDSEIGVVSRTLERRYMLPPGCSSSNVSYSIYKNEIRILARSTPPPERTIPIVVQDS